MLQYLQCLFFFSKGLTFKLKLLQWEVVGVTGGTGSVLTVINLKDTGDEYLHKNSLKCKMTADRRATDQSRSHFQN